MHRYFVYVLASKRNGVLYVGVTNDIARRMEQHKEEQLEGFTKQYHVKKLVYLEQFDYIDKAIEREKCIKRWKREWKIELIEKINPDWRDLYEELNNWL